MWSVQRDSMLVSVGWYMVYFYHVFRTELKVQAAYLEFWV